MATYYHKDSYRYWWKLEIEKSHINEETEDWYWSYRLFIEDTDSKDGYRLVFSDRIEGQYDIQPKVSAIIKEFLHRMMCMGVDFAKEKKN